jgi:hypothetical protein
MGEDAGKGAEAPVAESASDADSSKGRSNRNPALSASAPCLQKSV